MTFNAKSPSRDSKIKGDDSDSNMHRLPPTPSSSTLAAKACVPDLSHLTPEEREIIESVLERQRYEEEKNLQAVKPGAVSAPGAPASRSPATETLSRQFQISKPIIEDSSSSSSERHNQTRLRSREPPPRPRDAPAAENGRGVIARDADFSAGGSSAEPVASDARRNPQISIQTSSSDSGVSALTCGVCEKPSSSIVVCGGCELTACGECRNLTAEGEADNDWLCQGCRHDRFRVPTAREISLDDVPTAPLAMETQSGVNVGSGAISPDTGIQSGNNSGSTTPVPLVGGVEDGRAAPSLDCSNASEEFEAEEASPSNGSDRAAEERSRANAPYEKRHHNSRRPPYRGPPPPGYPRRQRPPPGGPDVRRHPHAPGGGRCLPGGFPPPSAYEADRYRRNSVGGETEPSDPSSRHWRSPTDSSEGGQHNRGNGYPPPRKPPNSNAPRRRPPRGEPHGGRYPVDDGLEDREQHPRFNGRRPRRSSLPHDKTSSAPRRSDVSGEDDADAEGSFDAGKPRLFDADPRLGVTDFRADGLDRPTPPKPRKYKPRSSYATLRPVVPKQPTLSSSDDEVKSTPDYTSADDLESESVVSERGDFESATDDSWGKDEVMADKIKKFLKHPVAWQPAADDSHLIGHMKLKKVAEPGKDASSILGLKVVGGKRNDAGESAAFITKVKRGSIADSVGRLCSGDQVLEWNGQSLTGLSAERVSEIVLKSKTEPQVELIVLRKIDRTGSDLLEGVYDISGHAQALNRSTYMRENASVRGENSSSTVIGGRIQISLGYDSAALKLIVGVLSASELPPKQEFSEPRNPFCTLYLLPDRSERSKRKTSVVRATNEPCWDQTFVYSSVKKTDLNRRALEVTVYDFDRFGSYDLVGEVNIDLSTAPLEHEPQWYLLTSVDDHMGKSSKPVRGPSSSSSSRTEPAAGEVLEEEEASEDREDGENASTLPRQPQRGRPSRGHRDASGSRMRPPFDDGPRPHHPHHHPHHHHHPRPHLMPRHPRSRTRSPSGRTRSPTGRNPRSFNSSRSLSPPQLRGREPLWPSASDGAGPAAAEHAASASYTDETQSPSRLPRASPASSSSGPGENGAGTTTPRRRRQLPQIPTKRSSTASETKKEEQKGN